MNPATQNAITSLRKLRVAHFKLRQAEEQADKDLEMLEDRWLPVCRELMPDELDEDTWPDDLDDDEYQARANQAHALAEKLREYLWSGEPEGVPPHAIEELAAERQEFLPVLHQIVSGVEQARRRVRAPHGEVVRRLGEWLDAVRSSADGAPVMDDDWPVLLRAWREAVDATTREAAELFELSASAIVRYERGSRSASLPSVSAMIERIASTEGVLPDTKERRVVRRTWRLLGGTGSSTQWIDSMQVGALQADQDLRDEIVPLLEGLEGPELKVVATLTRNRTALTALVTWAEDYVDEPLRPVLNAFVAAGLRSPLQGSTDESEVAP